MHLLSQATAGIPAIFVVAKDANGTVIPTTANGILPSTSAAAIVAATQSTSAIDNGQQALLLVHTCST
jgi:hypothetical protein